MIIQVTVITIKYHERVSNDIKDWISFLQVPISKKKKQVAQKGKEKRTIEHWSKSGVACCRKNTRQYSTVHWRDSLQKTISADKQGFK